MKEITYEFCEEYPTLQDAMSAVKGMILHRMEDALDEWNKRFLIEEISTWANVGFKRKDGDAHASLYVNINETYDRQLVRDIASGDDYAMYAGKDFVIKFSWPAWGSDTIENNAPRIKLMQDTMELAKEIEAYLEKFPKIVRRVQTRQQREEGEARHREKEIEFRVRIAMKQVMKGMRVGSERVALFTNVPKGKYEGIDIVDKRFTAYVNEEMADPNTPGATSKGTIIRTA